MIDRFFIDKCSEKIPDHFRLVVLAAYRANAIASGASVEIDREGSKSPSIALKEIALGVIDPAAIEEAVIKSFQKYSYLEVSKDSEDSLH